MSAVTLGGFLLRLIQLGNGSIWYDEAFSIHLSRQDLPAIVAGTAADTMPPLYYFLLHFWMSLGQSEFIIRLLSAFLSVPAIPLVYFIGSRLFKREAGIFAAMAVAVAPYHIYWAQEAKMYSLLTLASLLSIAAFLVAWRCNKPRDWLAFAAATALAFYTHNLAFLVLASLDTFALFHLRRALSLWRPLLVSHLAVFVLFLPWLPLLPGQVSKVSGRFWIDKPNSFQWALSLQDFIFGTERLRGILPWGLDYFTLFISLLAFGFALLVLLRRVWNKDQPGEAAIFVLVLLFAPIVLLYLLSFWRGLYADRAIGLSAAALAIMIGYLCSEAISRPRLVLSIALPLLLAVIVSLGYKYTFYGSDHLAFEEAVEFIKEEYQEGDAVIYTNKSTFFPGHFYYQFPVEYMLHDNPDSPFNDLLPATAEAIGFRTYTVEEAAPGHRRIWVMLTAGPDMDYDMDRLVLPLSQTHSRLLVKQWSNRLFVVLLSQAPKDIFQNATTLRDDGRYKEAMMEYQKVVSAFPNIPEAGSALLELGRLHFKEGEYQRASEIFQRLRLDPGATDIRPLATFWLARSYAEDGQVSEAEKLFGEYLEYGPAVSDYVRLIAAEALGNAGLPDKALSHLGSISLDNLPPSRATLVIRRRAEYMLALKNFGASADWYDKLFQESKDYWEQAEALFQRSKALQEAGDHRGSRNLLHLLLSDYPRSPSALSALEELDGAPSAPAVTPAQRGVVYYYRQRNSEAMEALETYVQQRQEDQDGVARALYYLALLHQRFERDDQAIDLLRKALNQHPDSQIAEDAGWELGTLLESMDNCPEAREIYQRLRREYPRGEYAQDAKFREGMCLYKEGSFNEAARLWSDTPILDFSSPKEKARGMFWTAKAHLSMERKKEAQKLLEQIMSLDPDGYYGIRATDLQAGRKAIENGKYQATSLDSANVRHEHPLEALSWLAYPSDALKEETLTNVRNNWSFRRGVELVSLGLAHYASSEFWGAIAAFNQDPLALYLLAGQFQEMGQYNLSIGAAQQLMRAIGLKEISKTPPEIRSLLYPAPFSSLIEEESKRRDLDPLLLYSMIRQESMFNPDATSSAAATGLTQVVPATANEIADNLRIYDFKQKDLYKPYVSVMFGSYYLRRMLNFFQNNPVHAVAAYNGGPGNALRWSRGRSISDPDLFLEQINFQETALYVRIVVENYRQYQELYRPRG